MFGIVVDAAKSIVIGDLVVQQAANSSNRCDLCRLRGPT
jgi:hypothetical protein